MKPAERMKIPRQEMPEQEPDDRRCNFSEVNYGLATEAARLEAERELVRLVALAYAIDHPQEFRSAKQDEGGTVRRPEGHGENGT